MTFLNGKATPPHVLRSTPIRKCASRAIKTSSTEKYPGAAPAGAAPGCFHLSLEVQLQSKLNLSRIVRSIARRSNLTEGRAGEVPRISDRRHAVAAEVGGIEIRVIEDVEELSPELRREPLVDGNRLEYRQGELAQRRSVGRGGATAENSSTSQREASGRW